MDAVNHEGKTALDLALGLKADYSNDRVGIIQELEMAGRRQLSLHCLAAKAVLDYRFEYSAILPHSLSCIVSWHECDAAVVVSKKAA